MTRDAPANMSRQLQYVSALLLHLFRVTRRELSSTPDTRRGFTCIPRHWCKALRTGSTVIARMERGINAADERIDQLVSQL